jgi:hypothetical protein
LADVEYKLVGENKFGVTTRPIHNLIVIVTIEDQTFEEETKAIKDDNEVNEIDNRPAVSYQQPRKSTVTQHRRGAASLGRGTGPGTSGTGRTTLKSPPLADKTEETAQFNEG